MEPAAVGPEAAPRSKVVPKSDQPRWGGVAVGLQMLMLMLMVTAMARVMGMVTAMVTS